MFDPEISVIARPVSHHPLENIVKDKYANKLKYAHNSVNNPQYPVKKKDENKLSKHKIKLAVVGVRVNKEFIHCTQLVKGLYKYKSKYFDCPEIKAVTATEWPRVWNDYKIKFGGIAYCLQSPVVVLINDKLLGGDKELKDFVNSKYVYHLSLDYHKICVDEFASFVNTASRPCAYMHIAINDELVGTMIFKLYADLVPLTCENFLRLCQNTKGGYSGTPIHRIVQDGWVQAGGYGLKDTKEMSCENFSVPHDRRGVLCMANDGRHIDCSTQFFVLLQPAPWMVTSYVAFGQLIEGEETLKAVEKVPTYYESPLKKITIAKAGIFNMDCHDITINKDTKAYIQSHIEDLIALGELFYEELMQRVFTEIDRREAASFAEEQERGDLEVGKSSILHVTERFIRKRSELTKLAEDQKSEGHNDTNQDFDVESYSYEPEEYHYKQATPPTSIVVRPEKPYYIPLTDVPYPGEKDSTFDLKKFLKGDYCLESDLNPNDPKKILVDKPSDSSDTSSETPIVSDMSLASDEEREIRQYLRANSDKISFTGKTIMKMAREYRNSFGYEILERINYMNEDEIKKSRSSSSICSEAPQIDRKVSVAVSSLEKPDAPKINRRQTGFIRSAHRESKKGHKQHTKGDKDVVQNEGTRKVRIIESRAGDGGYHRRSTLARGLSEFDDASYGCSRPSVLKRLYDVVFIPVDDGPTFRDCEPFSTQNVKNLLLTRSSMPKMRSDDEMKYYRPSVVEQDDSYERMINLQHSKKCTRKISSDYVKIMDHMEHKIENSLRSIEFAKKRPFLTVAEYQAKNQKRNDDGKGGAVKLANINIPLQTVYDIKNISMTSEDVQMPGATPDFSSTSTEDD